MVQIRAEIVSGLSEPYVRKYTAALHSLFEARLSDRRTGCT
jgi:hypothetical protein